MTIRERNRKHSSHGEKKLPLKYERPKLEKFGNLSHLTRGIGGSMFDPGHNSLTKMGS